VLGEGIWAREEPCEPTDCQARKRAKGEKAGYLKVGRRINAWPELVFELRQLWFKQVSCGAEKRTGKGNSASQGGERSRGGLKVARNRFREKREDGGASSCWSRLGTLEEAHNNRGVERKRGKQLYDREKRRLGRAKMAMVWGKRPDHT